jgi:N-methylhydantoinase A/oxoprolinase/acetone carboxylase beta subunit
VPPNAGVGSALGFFTAPRAFDLVRSHKVALAEADFSEIEEIFKELEIEGARTLQKSGEADDLRYERSVDMRFVGQGSETNVPVPEADVTSLSPDTVRGRFDEIYKKLYGRTYPDSPVEFINFKVRAKLPERLLKLPRMEKGSGTLEHAIKGQREAYSGIVKEFIPHTVYDRYRLFPEAIFQGPAIIEERESTVIVGEDASVSVDEYGFLWIDLPQQD